ncbi:TlpA family protein disulfide reductase [Deinococcus sp.]|uniref:TlpA family protein disulfide reductase n=1 Tax=Deinococcus sp. TaxID=47478 RepID=UPI003B5A4735
MTTPLKTGLLGLLMASSLAQAVRPGEVAPDFTLQTPAGETVKLSGLRGQTVILNFWATWCAPCKEELPELSGEAARLGLKHFYAVSGTDSPQKALAYFKKAELPGITLLVDAPKAKGTTTSAGVLRDYRILGQPMTVFIAPDGKVSAVHFGYLPAEQFQGYLKQLRGKAGK